MAFALRLNAQAASRAQEIVIANPAIYRRNRTYNGIAK